MVLIVEVDEFAESKMTGERRGLRRDAFHQIAVADDAICPVTDQLKTGTIVARGEVRFGHCHTHAITKPLP